MLSAPGLQLSGDLMALTASVPVEPRLDRLAADLQRLRSYTLSEQPFTRLAFSPVYLEERKWLRQRMTEAGLVAAMDPAGNLIGVRPSHRPTRAPVMVGSHTDTVPSGGLFDGTVGVVAGLEVARLVQEFGLELPFGLEVVDFLAEEPCEFGLSCLGSRALVGELTPSDLARADAQGRKLGEMIRQSGGDPDRLPGAVRRPGDLSAYLEVHIEQGPVLEGAGCPIGIVTGIAGIRRYVVTIVGKSAHAGTTPMSQRKDALLGASEAILVVESLASMLSVDNYFVATVGSLEVLPQAANVVPGRARLLVEARALDAVLLDGFQAELSSRLQQIGFDRRLDVSLEAQSASAVVTMDHGLQALVAEAAAGLSIPTMAMASGAGHDAAHMAAIAPAAMIFIPCRGGVSHAPEEHAELADIATGVRVIYSVVEALARGKLS